MKIDYFATNEVRAADWRCTHVLKPDLRVLTESMLEHGWLMPIVVHRPSMTIIDGFHRWMIAQGQAFRTAHPGKVPVMLVDCDEIDARLMHVRLNRGRGQIVTRFLVMLMQDIDLSGKYEDRQIRTMLGMSTEELNLLRDGTMFKHRKISEYEYSKAWVPVEVPANTPGDEIVIDRPPNPDR